MMEGSTGGKLNQTFDQTDCSSGLPEITRLTEQLLFTWGHLKEQAQGIKPVPFETKKQQYLLDEMINDAHKMDQMLLALKRAIRAL